MKKTITLVTVLIGLILSFSYVELQAQKTTEVERKISPYVFQRLAKNSKKSMQVSVAPVLVFLKEQADVSMASLLPNREAKLQVVYKALSETALRTQKGLLNYLEQEQLEHRAFYIANFVAVYGATQEQIETMAAREDVAHINLNPEVQNKLPRGVATKTGEEPVVVGPEANLVAVGATKVWSDLETRGENIVIAGEDTGVEWDHPALKKHYRGLKADGSVDHTYNWHDSIHKNAGSNVCGVNTKAPCDDDQHGTHTMGTMVGDDGAGNQIGMAPGAKWIGCRNMDAGAGTPASYIECFEYFLAPYPYGGNPMTDGKPEMAPHVINNSWGCPPEEGCEGSEFVTVLKNMKAAGIMMVVSAGNDGPSCASIQSPPATQTDSTFSVGALDHRSGTIASFSSRGPSTFDQGVGPDVSAPGVNIRSSIPGRKYVQFGWSGTSMAGPHVAGLVALLWSKHPNLIGDIDATSEIIRKTAQAKTTTQSCGGVSGEAIPNNVYGYGYIDAFAAVSAN